jgi:hypothetical protein
MSQVDKLFMYRIAPGPFFYGLVTSEKDWLALLDEMKFSGTRPPWITPGSDATTHHLEKADGARAAVVCMRPDSGHSMLVETGLVVHECAHIWQYICQTMRENEPSSEFEAYTLQMIVMDLLDALQRAQKRRRKKK